MSSECVNLWVKGLGESMNAAEFTKEDFDVKSFSAAMMKTSQLSEHLANLATSINTLDKEIKEQVSANHENLLDQAVNIETLEEMLSMVQTRISSLKSTSERLRIKIETPFDELNLRVVQLSRLQATCDTLRKIKGILQHGSNLRSSMAKGVKEIVKSAQNLSELDILLKNFDTSGIECIENDVHFAHKSRREIEELSQVILEKGIAHQDQNQIGIALQVYYLLGVLDKKVVECLKINENNFSKKSQELLDSTNLTLQSTSSVANLQSSASMGFISSSGQFPGRTTMPNVGQMTNFRAQLWNNFEKLMDLMYDSCSQVYQLQLILEKKKDLVTNVLYLEEVKFDEIFKQDMYLMENDQLKHYKSIYCTHLYDFKQSMEFLYQHWRLLCQILAQTIQIAVTKSNHVKQTLQDEYTKVLRLINELWLRVVQMNPLIDKYRYAMDQKKSAAFSNSYEIFKNCFIELENSFLAKSLNQLFSPINLIFSGEINRADMETFIKALQTHLQCVQYDNFSSEQAVQHTIQSMKKKINLTSFCTSFSDKIVANICKSIQLYSNKAEQLMNTLISELNQLVSSSHGASIAGTKSIFSFSTGPPYQIQMKNLDYVNLTHDLMEQLENIVSGQSFEEKYKEKIFNSLKSLVAFEENSLRPFVDAACNCVKAVLFTMHQEDFSQAQTTSSLYIRELNQVIQRISRDYLQLYNCKKVLNEYLNQISIACIEIFIMNASLIRPINDLARSRLKVDSEQLESIIENCLTPKLSDLGNNYKNLKAFRHLLNLQSPYQVNEPSSLGVDIVDESFYTEVLAESLPYHVLLHYLFSYAPEDLKSPYESLGNWTLSKYSDWLEKHTNERERLMVIKSCRESYVQAVKQRKEKTYATIYPLMFRILEKGLQSALNTL